MHNYVNNDYIFYMYAKNNVYTYHTYTYIPCLLQNSVFESLLNPSRKPIGLPALQTKPLVLSFALFAHLFVRLLPCISLYFPPHHSLPQKMGTPVP